MGAAFLSSAEGWRDSGLYAVVPRTRWQDLGGLKTDGLEAVFRYYDGQTDDRLLTQAVKQSAQDLGARMHCPADFEFARKVELGYQICFTEAGSAHNVECRVLVNATGPWVNRVLDQIEHEVNPVQVDLVQGTHLVFPNTHSEHCFYVEAPQDGRAVFVLPWQGKTLVGTTETVYHGDPGKAVPLESEINYLCETLDDYFPQWGLQPEDSFCGLRVLPRSDRAAFFRSRDTQVLVDHAAEPHLVVLYGGKLTDYRATAQNLLSRLIATLGPRVPVADTAQLPLRAASLAP